MRYLLILLFAFGSVARGVAQEAPRFKPIAHVFANAEWNPGPAETRQSYSFWIGRLMIGGDYRFTDKWSTRVLIDRTSLPGSVNTMYVKFAYLSWTPNDRFRLDAGVVPQNSYVPYEQFYGYRFVAETFQDRYFRIPSSDIGVLATYRLNKALSLDVSIVNGDGPRAAQDLGGKLQFSSGLSLNLSDRLQGRIFYYYRQKPAEENLLAQQLASAWLGYKAGDRFRFGAEFNWLKHPAYKEGESIGPSAFANIRLNKSLEWLARYDYLKTTSMINESEEIYSTNALITGLSLTPAKGIRLCLNYQGELYASDPQLIEHRVLLTFEYKL